MTVAVALCLAEDLADAMVGQNSSALIIWRSDPTCSMSSTRQSSILKVPVWSGFNLSRLFNVKLTRWTPCRRAAHSCWSARASSEGAWIIWYLAVAIRLTFLLVVSLNKRLLFDRFRSTACRLSGVQISYILYI